MAKKYGEDADDIQEDIDNLLTKTENKIITKTISKTSHYYPLTKEFARYEDFDDLIRLLLTVPSGDIIRLYINSPGGRLDIADNIIMKMAEAQDRGVIIYGELGVEIASAATAVALQCTDITVSPLTSFTIHNWSSGLGVSNATELFDKAVFNKKQSEKWIRITYNNFLAEEELEDIIAHPRDLEFTGDEVLERWNNKMAIENPPEPSLDEIIQSKVAEALAKQIAPKTSRKKAPAKKPVTKRTK